MGLASPNFQLFELTSNFFKAIYFPIFDILKKQNLAMKSKAIKIVGIVVVAIVALVAIVGAFMSPKSHMEWSIVVNAQPSAVFQQINSFKNHGKWSPWMEQDPNTKTTFEGPDSGVGSKMSWTSEKLGNGSQWIIESDENKHLKTGMSFEMEGAYTSDIYLEPTDGGTKVTWTYDGDVSGAGMATSIMGKVMGKFMDGMLGPDYEKGLSNLKTLAESQPQNPASADSTTVKD